jgi:hypothetical protein
VQLISLTLARDKLAEKKRFYNRQPDYWIDCIGDTPSEHNKNNQ